MGFFIGLGIGCVASPFLWELLKWGFKKLKEKAAK